MMISKKLAGKGAFHVDMCAGIVFVSAIGCFAVRANFDRAGESSPYRQTVL